MSTPRERSEQRRASPRVRAADRRRWLAIDAGLGLAVALLALLIAPGLAAVGLGALVVLVACAVTFAIERRRARRGERRAAPDQPGDAADGPPNRFGV